MTLFLSLAADFSLTGCGAWDPKHALEASKPALAATCMSALPNPVNQASMWPVQQKLGMEQGLIADLGSLTQTKIPTIGMKHPWPVSDNEGLFE